MSDKLHHTAAGSLTHEQVWNAIDALAARHDLTPSGLAKKGGLDPTTFNKSKRMSSDQRQRWPSTESIAKVLDATGSSLDEFLGLLLSGEPAARRRIPLIGLAQAGSGGFFDDGGYPAGSGWDEVSFPDVQDEHAYALEISGESMLPLFRTPRLTTVRRPHRLPRHPLSRLLSAPRRRLRPRPCQGNLWSSRALVPVRMLARLRARRQRLCPRRLHPLGSRLP